MIAAVVMASVANFNAVWNQFYHDLPKLFDTGWYAALVHRSAPLLQNPPAVVFSTIGRDYYATHFSPLLWLLSWPSYLLPLGLPAWLACLEAGKYGLLAIVVWWAGRQFAGETDAKPLVHRLTAGLIVFLAPFNGVDLAVISYPHFESWFIVLSLAFLVALFSGRTRLAAIPFFATLMLREDMGFHLFGVLFLAVLAARLVQGRWSLQTKTWMAYAAGAFAWSGGALVLMHLCFPGDHAFSRVYGYPPFIQTGWRELARRLVFQYQSRGYIWMPALVYVAWAAVTRSWWVLIGYLAFVPWYFLNFTAVDLAPAALSLYYSFPFGLALLWPLAGRIAFSDGQRPREGLGWIAAALFVSLVGFVRGNDWAPLARDMLVPDVSAKNALDAVTARAARAVARGVPTGVDGAIAALAPQDFTAHNLFGQTARKLDLTVLYSNGRSVPLGWETGQTLHFRYRVAGTPVVVASAEPLSWPYLKLYSTSAGSILPFLRDATPSLAWEPQPFAGAARMICRGPAWYFPPGQTWTATFTLWVKRGAGPDSSAVVCKVTGLHGARVLATASIPLADLPPRWTRVVRKLAFVVPAGVGATLETRITAPADSAGQIEDITLQTQDSSPAAALSSTRS